MDETLKEEMADLVSAEDFLDFFGVTYDPHVVQVNRLHILQRYHDYLSKQATDLPAGEAVQRPIYRQWLERAYLDFVDSSALQEKVFRVFHHTPMPGGGMSSFVSLDKVLQP